MPPGILGAYWITVVTPYVGLIIGACRWFTLKASFPVGVGKYLVNAQLLSRPATTSANAIGFDESVEAVNAFAEPNDVKEPSAFSPQVNCPHLRVLDSTVVLRY